MPTDVGILCTMILEIIRAPRGCTDYRIWVSHFNDVNRCWYSLHNETKNLTEPLDDVLIIEYG